MTQFPIRIDGAVPLNDGASAFLPPVSGSSVPPTEAQRLDTMAYLRRRIAEAGRRAQRAKTDAFYEDAQRDIARFARLLADIASRPAGRVPYDSPSLGAPWWEAR